MFRCEKGHPLILIQKGDTYTIRPDTGEVKVAREQGILVACLSCGTIMPFPDGWVFNEYDLQVLPTSKAPLYYPIKTSRNRALEAGC